jgi:hypothetical protein
MSGRKDDTFSIPVLKEEDPERKLPDHLELVDGDATARRKRLKGGAYDPYQKQDPGRASDTMRMRKPRVDLRKLSEWIKTTQRVKSKRDDDEPEPAEQSRTPKPDK